MLYHVWYLKRWLTQNYFPEALYENVSSEMLSMGVLVVDENRFVGMGKDVEELEF